MTYDAKQKAFRIRIQMKVGNRFKFVIDGGKKWSVSKRYTLEVNTEGVENNTFIPNDIKYVFGERKKCPDRNMYVEFFNDYN